jgi:hypothetical protein
MEVDSSIDADDVNNLQNDAVVTRWIMSDQNDNSGHSRLKRIYDIVYAIFVHAVFVTLILVGGLVINAIIRDWRLGKLEPGMAVISGLFGLFLTLVGVGFFYLAYVGAPRFLNRLERKREKYRDRPWLINRQWRTRRIVHSTKFTAWFMWLWCLFWWSILGFLWSVNTDLILVELRGSWGQAIPSSLPFVAGIIGLVVAISLTWQRYRFGDAVLIIETLPGYLGERFRGKVQARLKGRLNEPAGVTLTCGSLTSHQKRTTNGRSETVWVTDELWSDSHDLHPTQTIFGKNLVTLPIDISLPSGLPESGHILDDPQIVWKLKVTPGSVLDRPLGSEFEVPVFARRHET